MLREYDFQYICRVIGNLSGIPIRVYRKGLCLYYHSVVDLPVDPIVVCWDSIKHITANVGYYVTEQFHYYGIMNSGNIKIVIGPSKQIPEGEPELRKLGFQADVHPEDMENFVQGMKSIFCMPLESILQILCIVNYIINGEKLEVKDIAIYENEQNVLKHLWELRHSEQNFADDNLQFRGHNTYNQEQQILRLVRKGDIPSLTKWMASAPAIRGGALTLEQLRQIKNTFFVTATLASRAAIQGGLSVDEAFSLSDAYIQKCELLQTMDQITNLQYHMVLEFTEHVNRIRHGTEPTKLVIAVSNYIRQHLSESIRVEDIAKALFLSRPYLSAKFKKETGETLTDFIWKEKTEEAKRLLRHSDKSFSSIGAYLGFSSPGHFSQVFKKYTGKTPSEYREKYGA